MFQTTKLRQLNISGNVFSVIYLLIKIISSIIHSLFTFINLQFGGLYFHIHHLHCNMVVCVLVHLYIFPSKKFLEKNMKWVFCYVRIACTEWYFFQSNLLSCLLHSVFTGLMRHVGPMPERSTWTEARILPLRPILSTPLWV